MDSTIALINDVIEGHRKLEESAKTTERAVNDVQAMTVLTQAQKDFVPESFDQAKRTMQHLLDTLEQIKIGLLRHFELEEKGLLAAFEREGDAALAAAFRELLDEHEQLITRMDKSQKDLSTILTENPSRHVWAGKAAGIKNYINHTMRLIDAHAKSEEELFESIKKIIKK